jgi:hypothetical protein
MTLHQGAGMAAATLLFIFLVFAFRQGLGVKPDDRADHGPSVGYGGGGGT